MLGINLQLLIGPTIPRPASTQLMEALRSVEVTHSDEGRSAFQLVFQIGRAGQADLQDYQVVNSPLLRPFCRVILVVTLNATPRVLMDGMITHHQLSPGEDPGSSTFTVTGEDVSVMMDMVELSISYPAQNDALIALMVIGRYAALGILPIVIPPLVLDLVLPIERVPVQKGTDLAHLKEMASRYGFVFYVSPGPSVGQNTAYWGPPIRAGVPQRALTLNMGPGTNVETMSFQYDALAPTLVADLVMDSRTNATLPVLTFATLRFPLSARPMLGSQNFIRTSLLEKTEGLSYLQAWIGAQGQTDRSMDNVVTATGELNALRYGDLLQARGLVGVRGAGQQYDGLYYVKSVTHSIQTGEYKQSFALAREGLGTTTGAVRV